jgi:hypothetical protein
MHTIILSDVFGITPALIQLKDKLGANRIIDPYDGKFMSFINEADAYSYFVKEVGHDIYLSQIVKYLLKIECKTTLIGFSIGASAIWRLSEDNTINNIEQAFCFYGSQIRNYTQIVPQFKTHLIFPKKETHFDVSKLIQKLKNKDNVHITQVEYLHGFMNSHSNNFDKVGYSTNIHSIALLV